MGWLYMNLAHTGSRTAREYLDRQFTFTAEKFQLQVLKSALVGMSTYYAAVEKRERHGSKREVVAVVCLVQYKPNAADGMTFGYKDMDESMGPYEASCPRSILELLTPTDDEYAKQWRQKCWDRLERRLPQVGETFTLAEPLTFTDDQTHSTFTVVNSGGRVLYEAAGKLYRISRLKERQYTIATAPAAVEPQQEVA